METNKIEALQNAVNSMKVQGMELYIKQTQDKRKKINRYFLTLNKTTISPVLDYTQMNHFIMGLSRGLKLVTPCTPHS